MEDNLLQYLIYVIQILCILAFALVIRFVLTKKSSATRSNLNKVLLVDDDPDIINLATKVLQKKGVEVVAITDPLIALEILKNDHDYDLLVTDIYMPNIDGIQLSKLAHVKIPVLMMTGGPRNQIIDEIYQNCDAHINKKNLQKQLYNSSLQAISNWENKPC